MQEVCVCVYKNRPVSPPAFFINQARKSDRPGANARKTADLA